MPLQSPWIGRDMTCVQETKYSDAILLVPLYWGGTPDTLAFFSLRDQIFEEYEISGRY
jgi:hypothetical protein